MADTKGIVKFKARIATELGTLIEQRDRLQKICDELDELLDKQGDLKTRLLLDSVQACIDAIRDAERELYIDYP